MSQIPSFALLGLAGFLVLGSAFWHASHQAFQILSNARARDLVADKRRNAEVVQSLVERRDSTLNLCQIWRVTNQIGAGACSALSFLGLGWAWWVALLVTLVLLSSILTIFSTVIAGQIGSLRPEATALLVAPTVNLAVKLSKLLAPLAWLVKRLKLPSPLTEDEARHEVAEDFREMVDEMAEDEHLNLEEEDRQILRSALELGTTLVREIIVPRTEMVTVNLSLSVQEALDKFIQSGFSRIPVIGEDSDDVRGVLYLKDVVARVNHRSALRTHPVHELMREAYFVPEVMLVDDLLRDMQTGAAHIALVIDEWGGTVGLVTIEDALEELVGEVTDEHDRDEKEPQQLDKNTWLVPARINIDDLSELVDLELSDDEVDTAGGLLARALNKVPLLGDSAEIQGLRLEVDQIEGRRRTMAWLRVTKVSPEGGKES